METDRLFGRVFAYSSKAHNTVAQCQSLWPPAAHNWLIQGLCWTTICTPTPRTSAKTFNLSTRQATRRLYIRILAGHRLSSPSAFSLCRQTMGMAQGHFFLSDNCRLLFRVESFIVLTYPNRSPTTSAAGWRRESTNYDCQKNKNPVPLSRSRSLPSMFFGIISRWNIGTTILKNCDGRAVNCIWLRMGRSC